MSLIDGLDKFSNTAKSLAVSAVGGVIAGAALVAGAKPWIALGVGLALLGLVITVFFEVLKRRKTSRGDALSRNLVSRGDVGPKFTAGVESFRKQGKSLYDIPWYLMVGEQGAGKTYAIKHSNIRFIPGMNEPDAGKSGTIGMDWWFAYNAVLLDTAGALLTNPEKTDQFREFLRLLRRCRPQLPINGMILAIPATALLSDTDGQMQAKAELIAQQFEFIQRELAIRFPVYVIITKSDQIEGFREYFYNFSDSSISNQIFGWSNPSSLDTAFQAEQVEKYLADVTTAIKRRRLTLLDDPKTPEDRTKRIDQTDALYAFPEQMTHVNGRLRYYLETVFMPGQWSSAPLFLRGIYFTSAVSEGSALDSDLAAALKVLPADLPPSLRVWEKNKSYFLRDLFNEKIFREKGLVTPSSTKNVDGQLRRQRAVVLGAGFAAVALLAAFTAYAYVQLDKSIGRFDTFWSTADDKDSLPPLSKVTWSEPPAPAATPSYYTENAALGTRNVGDKFDFMFAVPKLFVTNVDEQRKTAHRLLFEQCVLKPLYQRAADTLAREPNKKLWETLKTGVPKDEQLRAKQQAYVDLLGQLILVEAWISDTQGHVTANLQRPNFTAMFDALGKLADKSDKPDDWLKAIKDSFSQFYVPGDKTDWAPKTIWPADSAARGNLATAVEDAIGRIDAYGRSYADQSALDAVADAMVAYQDSEDKFAGVLKSAETIAKPEEFEPWHGKVTLPAPTALEDSLESLQTRLRGSAGKHLDELHGQAVIESGQVKDWNVVLRAYTGIIGTEAGDTLAGKTAQALGRGAEEINRIEKKSTHSDEELKRLDQRLLGEAPERFSADDAKWSYVRRRAAYEAVRKFLLQANLESVNLDNLAKSGDDLAANRKAVGDLTAVDSATREACNSALDTTLAYRQWLLWDAALKLDALTTKDLWAARVARESGAALPEPGPGYLSFKENPFVGDLAPSYNLNNVKVLFANWNLAKQALEAHKPLQQPAIAVQVAKCDEARVAYVKDYTQKWSDAFEVAAESLAAEKGPQAVVDALKTTDAGKIADDISQGLQDRWNVLSDALANVGGQQPAAADQAAIVGKLRGDGADFLKTWKGLYSANTGIRSAVSGLNEADVKAIQKLLTNADTDPASRYWQAMARALKNKLAGDCDLELKNALADLNRQLRFPLIWSGGITGPGDVMTAAEIESCRVRLDNLVSELVTTSNPLADLDKLSFKQEAWRKRVRDWAEQVTQEQVSIAVADAATLSDEAAKTVAANKNLSDDFASIVMVNQGAKLNAAQAPNLWVGAAWQLLKFGKALKVQNATETDHWVIGFHKQVTVPEGAPADDSVNLFPSSAGGWPLYQLVQNGANLVKVDKADKKNWLVMLRSSQGRPVGIMISFAKPVIDDILKWDPAKN